MCSANTRARRTIRENIVSFCKKKKSFPPPCPRPITNEVLSPVKNKNKNKHANIKYSTFFVRKAVSVSCSKVKFGKKYEREGLLD